MTRNTMEYNFKEIEDKWKAYWEKNKVYEVKEDTNKPKYYILDMFPYPSGAGLHVGHPLGYVASDIYARYKKLKGFNVLHPMGFDAFGLPAEQYALETGTHPAITTEKAIKRYKEQFDKIGFNYDWSRSVKTSDPAFYKWTQWMFLKLFGSWYNRTSNKAEAIDTLVKRFETEGCTGWAQFDANDHTAFTADQWKDFSESEKQRILMYYRLAYLSYAEVNWCPELGTVLANDEVKDGKSERGGYAVERKKMRQWFLRITEYSDRLLEGLDRIDWHDSLKEMQRNWIGRSEGAIIKFHLSQTLSKGEGLNTPRYYTTDGQTWNNNIEFAKNMRSDQTEAESILWEQLRAKNIGFRFRRQHPIQRFIVDFVCIEKGVVIEVDGKIHLQQQEEDKERTEVLKQSGFEVIRFTNEEVISNVDNVIATIKSALSQKDNRKVLSFGEDLGEVVLSVFTTRPDTIFGATFMVIAPEHELLDAFTTAEHKDEVEKYIAYVKGRTDVERQQEKRVTGAFTGSYAINPFNGNKIPIWIAEYVLIGYGTGAIMAVPADDERDEKFALKFNLPIVEIIDKSMYPGAGTGDKVGKMINSDFLNGLEVKDAIKHILEKIEESGIGQRKVNYRQRDAGFSRQRYWGEPIPIKHKVIGKPDGTFEGEGEHDDIAVPLDYASLPLILPEVSSYKPTGDGRAPLANNKDWVANNYETDTMPGYAGSSWYFLRYMDANNPNEFASKEKLDYWQNVDLYLGGTEHAVGHLLYSRFWHKFLFDLGLVSTDEPFKKLVNQGMIQGVSKFVYRGANRPDIFISKSSIERTLTDKELKTLSIASIDELGSISELHVDVRLVSDDVLDVESFKESRPEYANVKFILDEDGKYRCGTAVEKMSKSKYNVVNPDDVIEKHGADCFRMYEMFLGPIEQSKPWDDKGISGVSNFLRKFWRLFYDDKGTWKVTEEEEEATAAEYKILHKTLKKVTEDIERLSFNTAVSAFMICV
ncbi:MAG: leucine--tRNA ligase, partial [Bacteroidota bacterium]|nr:leucine--tRNA ligase [Bacteroidota bacterium]